VAYSSLFDHALADRQRDPSPFRAWLIRRLKIYLAAALVSACLFMIGAMSLAYPQAAWEAFTSAIPIAVGVALAGLSSSRVIAALRRRLFRR
jgi:CHASE2 domain-containing sensor protein